MNRRWLTTAALVLLAVFILVRGLQHWQKEKTDRPPAMAGLELPQLSDADYAWIGAGIFQNEAAGRVDKLTYWGAGEDFPSLGIGHFIWLPTGVDARFDEQVPDKAA